MRTQHLIHRLGLGWNLPLPTALDSPQTLLLAFAAPRYGADPAPFAELAQAFPQALMLGCSSAGEIAGDRVQDDSVSVAVVRFEHGTLRLASTPVAGPADAFHAGARLAAQLAGRGLRSVFVVSDGLAVNGSALADGLSRHLGPDVVVTGGLAGDGAAFQRTWVLGGQGAHGQAGRMAAVGLYGDRVRVGHGLDGGWQDFGPERRITRAEGTVLYELDGRPALDLYKTYLGERAQGLPGTALLFPLAVRREGAGQDKVVRTILGVDEAARSLTFAGDLPQGGVARLMRANAEQLIDSAGRAARQAMAGVAPGDALVISVSCVGRRLVLGERTEEEVEIVAESAPAGAAHVGFYSYGEIAPAVAGGPAALHNQTMTVTVVSEA